MLHYRHLSVYLSVQRKVDKALSYTRTLESAPYVWWHDGDPINRAPPFYIANAPPPETNYVKENGINCAGLINLVARKLGIKPLGGTIAWLGCLEMHSEKFDIDTDYPPGTLLIRKFNSVTDQGHLAIATGNKNLIHCYSESYEPIEKSNRWYDGFYTHTVRPQYWVNGLLPVKK